MFIFIPALQATSIADISAKMLKQYELWPKLSARQAGHNNREQDDDI